MRQVAQAFLEVQGRLHGAGDQAELDHGERDVWLNADDHGPGTPQPGHLGQLAQRGGGERVDHVEGGDVDDHPAGAIPSDLIDEVVLESDQL